MTAAVRLSRTGAFTEGLVRAATSGPAALPVYNASENWATGLKRSAGVFASARCKAEATARITSYNVCYTKLLRISTTAG